MKSLRARILLSVTSIVVLALVTLAALDFIYSKKLIEEDIKYGLEKTADNQAETIGWWFDTCKTHLKILAKSPIVISGSHEDSLNYLFNELIDNTAFENLCLIQPNGLAYGANGTVADVSNKEYFKKPMLEGKTVISDSETSIVTGKNIVVIATPVVVDGKIIGVLAGVISVDNIDRQVLDIKIQNTGYAYVVNREGTIVIHPQKNISNNKNILKSSDFSQEINKFGEEVIKGESGFSSYTDDRGKKYVAYTKIHNTDWSIVVNVPENEVNSRLVKFTAAAVIIMVGVISLVVLVIYLITNSIVTPIELLEANAKRITSGDLNHSIGKINSKDEIGRLARAFEKMLENLYASYEELESSNEEIIASEEELRRQNEVLQENREALQKSDERFRLAASASKISIWDWELDGERKSVLCELDEGMAINEVVYSVEEAINSVHPEDRENFKCAIKEHINGDRPYVECEFRIKAENGDYRWVLSRGKIVKDCNGKTVRMAGSNMDITELKQAEEKIRYLANHDSLTNLSNRNLLNERISKAFEEAKINKSKAALLYLDLDNFKTVNDMLGHNYGDALLKEVSNKVNQCVSDKDTVSRLGGDEFVILLSDIVDSNYIVEVAERINALFVKPYILNGQEFYISASIGIAVYPDNGEDAELLLKNADTAMYCRKNSGKNGYAFYNQDMNNKVIERIQMENYLRHAIERDEFVVHYQPQIDLSTNKISGFEALIRWNNPLKGMLSPADFISIAEETGLIIQMDEWVLSTACKQVKLWRDRGYDFNIAVNLSTKHFRQANLVEKINGIIEEAAIDPKYVELEITETTAMENITDTIKTLNKLKERGVTISLDDFGTGYSSLNYLKKLPIDVLKIDKGFIYDITENQNQEEIVNIIISLAHSMNLKVVAEGVETVDKLNFLKEHNCDKAQGYYFSKPLNKEGIEELLCATGTFRVAHSD